MLIHYTGNFMSNKKFGTRYNTLSYIEKAREIHSNYYDYSLVEYINSFSKINILCPTHGLFKQRACDHINQKQGCPKCSHNYAYTHTEFAKKSQEKYNGKFKIITPYIGMKHPITLSCADHGKFALKKAETHLNCNGGCPECWYLHRLENLKPGNISKIEKQWLDSLNITMRQHRIHINDRTFLVDGFDPNSNTVYECYGSYWHGNPEKYEPTEVNTKLNKTFGQLYEQTLARENLIKSKFNLVVKWV